MEQKVGRKLTKNEHVHHVNGDSLDNNLDNLEILTNSEHQKIEYKLRNP
ncbi:MAG: HNH endonuclease [Acidobacteriia bacterium]|nr:HNH endonuclease [Terriglobia bacterium]